MNTQFTRNQYNGFKLNGTLASKFRFSGHLRVWEIEHGQKFRFDGETLDYWILKDEFGARLSLFDKKLADSLVVGERYEIQGEIAIGKGGTFLNVKDASPLNGSDFTEEG